MLGMKFDGEKTYGIYNDQVEVIGTDSGTWTQTSTPFRIGDADASRTIDDAEVMLVLAYNNVLSDSEIQYDYLNPMNPITDDLVLWLNFHNVQDNIVPDLSGNGNDGTVYGASWGLSLIHI